MKILLGSLIKRTKLGKIYCIKNMSKQLIILTIGILYAYDLDFFYQTKFCTLYIEGVIWPNIYGWQIL